LGDTFTPGYTRQKGNETMFVRWFLLETGWGDRILSWFERVAGLGVMVIDDEPHGRGGTVWTFSAQLDNVLNGG